MKTSVVSFTRRRVALLCVAGVLAFTCCAPMVSAAADDIPEKAQVAVGSTLSPEGQHILVATLALAGLLIAVERVCCWRLGVCLRRDSADAIPRRQTNRRSSRPVANPEMAQAVNG